jgi:hypothetical protein
MRAANFMDAKTFNQNYELDRKAKGVRANAKGAPPEPLETILTADGTAYDASKTYYFFDHAAAEVRASAGLRRTGEHLCAIGLKVVAVSLLRSTRDGALADGQKFFKSEIERNQERIKNYELEKTSTNRSLKTFLMAKE